MWVKHSPRREGGWGVRFKMKAIGKILTFGRMIRFSHSVFALPFALVGALLASTGGFPSVRQVLWIVAACVGARSAAMAFNRLVDKKIDALNPRTKDRALPRGLLTATETAIFIVASSALLILSAYMLNPLAFYLSPVALAIVFFYSYTKRFTWGSQLFLGLALAVAPIGAWIAIRGTLEAPPLILGAGVLLWVAGFDVVYALQDLEFDKSYGLFSIPQRFGVGRSLWISRAFHFGTFLMFLWLFFFLDLGLLYLVGVVVVGLMLFYEQSLLREDDLSRLNTAFFTMNGIISVAFFIFTLGDVIASRR
jgi:4-hydroxybenzoate polyprenyltransferase